MDFDLVKKIIKIAEDADISGLLVEKDGFKVEVRREKAPQIITPPAPLMPQHYVVAESKTAIENEAEGVVAIISPMVGTFYRSPSPGSAPFVEVGERVESGKVVCIIEAMKLFNEIEAEVSGVVTKILVENGQPVEYGQKLMLVKKE